MIEIRDTRYKVGDKVYCKEFKCNAIITGISDYSFDNDEYYYNLRYDDGNDEEMIESMLIPYQEPPKTVWDLQNGDTYYAIDYGNMDVNRLAFYNDKIDLNRRKLGNCFLTKEEAESELERVKIEAEMLRLGGRRKFKKGEDNYYIACDFGSNYYIFIFNNNFDCFGIGAIYFDSTKECEKAIETIGEERIKRYYFGVEE